MVITSDRRKRSFRSSSENDRKRVSAIHAQFLEDLVEKKLPLGKQTTMFLVPIGHDVVRTKRVGFFTRKNPETGDIEKFLPREHLEKVMVTHSAFHEKEKRKYYFIFSSEDKPPRIVWSRYCVPLDAKELVPFPVHKKTMVTA